MFIKYSKRNHYNKIICLKRKGSLHSPFFLIILCIQTKTSKIFMEKLGFYDPNFSTRKFVINISRLIYWLSKGAIVGCSVKKLLVIFIHFGLIK